MDTQNAGLSEFLLCIISNIYFKILSKQSHLFTNEVFMEQLKYDVYKVPVLMGVGLFVFKNYDRYLWFGKGNQLVNKFLSTRIRFTIKDLTLNSDLSNNGDGTNKPPYDI
jgi:hypothetical protein